VTLHVEDHHLQHVGQFFIKEFIFFHFVEKSRIFMTFEVLHEPPTGPYTEPPACCALVCTHISGNRSH
jgi:hypothetical protein